jgi:hypothetical protein
MVGTDAAFGVSSVTSGGGGASAMKAFMDPAGRKPLIFAPDQLELARFHRWFL